MSDSTNPIWETIEKDEEMISLTRKLLAEWKLLPLFERVPPLFSSMMRENEQQSQHRPELLLTEEDGSKGLNWDCVLRIFMAQSASMQFLYAMGHLLRGHLSEINGHIRTMIECSGIAYLARIRPELKLGTLYHCDDKKYRKVTRKNDLFPERPKDSVIIDPIADLRADLRTLYDRASWMFHSNLAAVVSKVDVRVESTKESSLRFENTMSFHDAATNERLYVVQAGSFASTVFRVLRLFAAAFELPDGIWRRRLAEYEREMKTAFSKITKLDEAKI